MRTFRWIREGVEGNYITEMCCLAAFRYPLIAAAPAFSTQNW